MLTTWLMMMLMSPPTMAEPAQAPAMSEQADGRWLVEVVRTHGELSATGAVTFRAISAPDPAAPPHAGAGGARAWLALGEQLADGSPAEAVACAEKGLEELGADYADRTVRDDTSMKIALARSMAADQPADAAATLLRMLSERLEMYQELHEVEVDSP